MANSTYLNASLSGPPKYFQTSQGDGSLSGPFIPSVAIVDGSGSQITSFGGGTQYADGATQATPTGTVALGKNGANILHALSLDGSGYLNVNVAAGGASGGTSSSFGAAFPATGTASGFSDGTNMQTARVFDGDTGAGTEYNMGVILRKSGSGGTVEAGTSTNPLRTDPTGTTTQPVSGTITANIGTAGSLALDATLTGGTQKAIARGGAKGSTSAADVTSTASGSNHQALDVVIYDTSGNPITSFGGAGGTSMTDDAAFTPGTTAITPVGGTYRSTRDTVDDNDAGAFAITQRRALLACLETPNGDSAMDDTNDAVKTVLATVPNVANAGTFAVQESGGALTSLQLIDDAIVADDAAFTPATTKVMMAGFEFDDSSPDSVNEGDAGAARMSANRNIYTTLRDAAGNERGVNVNASNQLSVSVDNTPSVNLSQVGGASVALGQTTMSASLPIAIASNQSDVPIISNDATASGSIAANGQTVTLSSLNGRANFVIDVRGTYSATLQFEGSIDGTNFFSVNMTAINGSGSQVTAVASSTGAWIGSCVGLTSIRVRCSAYTSGTASVVIRAAFGTSYISGALSASSNQIGLVGAGTGTFTASATGNVAHDASDSGNPVKVGGKARQTNPTAVADGDRVDCFRDDVGRGVVVLNQCRDLLGSQNTTITSSTSETTIVTAGGSGVFNDLTSLTMTNKSATGTLVTLKDSTGGTTRGVYYVPATGGIVLTFPTPKPQLAAANNNWTLTCTTSVDSIYVTAEFAKNV